MGSSESRLTFQADLFQLSKQYYNVVMHVRQTNLFKQRNNRLEMAVETYLQDWKHFDTNNMDLLAVDTSHKLHPLDYGTKKVDKEYLINACLRQDEFCRKLHAKCINYEHTLENYEKFLKIIKSQPRTITVPSLNEDFMWHSHMTDHEKYKSDTKRILGFFLNHDDEIPKEKLKNLWDEALNKREDVYGYQKFGKYKIQYQKNQNIPTKNKQSINNNTENQTKHESSCHPFEICLKTKAQ